MRLAARDRPGTRHFVRAHGPPPDRGGFSAHRRDASAGPGPGRARTAWLWTAIGDREAPYTVYHFRTGRGRAGPRSFSKAAGARTGCSLGATREAARRAVFVTLMESAKRSEPNVFDYLSDMLRRLPACRADNWPIFFSAAGNPS